MEVANYTMTSCLISCLIFVQNLIKEENVASAQDLNSRWMLVVIPALSLQCIDGEKEKRKMIGTSSKGHLLFR